jgi:hypothetical protein
MTLGKARRLPKRGALGRKAFPGINTLACLENRPIKLILHLTSLTSLVCCLWVRPGAYPEGDGLKGASIG